MIDADFKIETDQLTLRFVQGNGQRFLVRPGAWAGRAFLSSPYGFPCLAALAFQGGLRGITLSGAANPSATVVGTGPPAWFQLCPCGRQLGSYALGKLFGQETHQPVAFPDDASATFVRLCVVARTVSYGRDEPWSALLGLDGQGDRRAVQSLACGAAERTAEFRRVVLKCFSCREKTAFRQAKTYFLND